MRWDWRGLITISIRRSLRNLKLITLTKQLHIRQYRHVHLTTSTDENQNGDDECYSSSKKMTGIHIFLVIIYGCRRCLRLARWRHSLRRGDEVLRGLTAAPTITLARGSLRAPRVLRGPFGILRVGVIMPGGSVDRLLLREFESGTRCCFSIELIPSLDGIQLDSIESVTKMPNTTSVPF